jgi:nucleoside-diphosphate-sugar epimerase
MKRILITGASGFLGRHIVSMLSSRGFEIHTAGRSPIASISPVIVHHLCDLLEVGTPEALIHRIRPSHLLHLAWCADAGRFWTTSENLKWLSASTRLFEAFADCDGHRGVGIGSCAEYDWSHTDDLSEFRSSGIPSTLYGKSKRAAGEFLQAFASGTKLKAAWGRLFFLYGPGGHPQRVPGAIIESLLRGQPTPCPAGTQWRDYLFIKDAAAAVVTLVESDVCGPINIGSGQPVRVIDLIEAAARATGNVHLLQIGQVLTQTVNNPERIVADVGRLQSEVGFVPQTTLAQGMAETVAWWQSEQRLRAA